jgi:hypothetical protein
VASSSGSRSRTPRAKFAHSLLYPLLVTVLMPFVAATLVHGRRCNPRLRGRPAGSSYSGARGRSHRCVGHYWIAEGIPGMGCHPLRSSSDFVHRFRLGRFGPVRVFNGRLPRAGPGAEVRTHWNQLSASAGVGGAGRNIVAKAKLQSPGRDRCAHWRGARLAGR